MDDNYDLLMAKFTEVAKVMIKEELAKFKKELDVPVFGKVISTTDVTVDEITTTTHAIVDAFTGVTGSIQNKSGERLYAGDSVKLTASGGNLGNSVISLRCAN